MSVADYTCNSQIENEVMHGSHALTLSLAEWLPISSPLYVFPPLHHNGNGSTRAHLFFKSSPLVTNAPSLFVCPPGAGTLWDSGAKVPLCGHARAEAEQFGFSGG